MRALRRTLPKSNSGTRARLANRESMRSREGGFLHHSVFLWSLTTVRSLPRQAAANRLWNLLGHLEIHHAEEKAQRPGSAEILAEVGAGASLKKLSGKSGASLEGQPGPGGRWVSRFSKYPDRHLLREAASSSPPRPPSLLLTGCSGR